MVAEKTFSHNLPLLVWVLSSCSQLVLGHHYEMRHIILYYFLFSVLFCVLCGFVWFFVCFAGLCVLCGVFCVFLCLVCFSVFCHVLLCFCCVLYVLLCFCCVLLRFLCFAVFFVSCCVPCVLLVWIERTHPEL